MSSLVDVDSFGERALVYLPKYVSADDPLLLASDEEVYRDFLHGLRRIFPDVTMEDVVGWRVDRQRYVFALPTLGYSQVAPPIRTSVPGLFNVNEAVRQAEEAVPIVLGEPEGQVS